MTGEVVEEGFGVVDGVRAVRRVAAGLSPADSSGFGSGGDDGGFPVSGFAADVAVVGAACAGQLCGVG